MQRLSGRGHHVQDIVLRRIWRNVQTVEMKIGHLHARMTEAILFRLSGELVLIFHIQNASRLHANHRGRVFALITKFGFAGDRIRRGCERYWRTRLWQFGNYSVLHTRSGEKQSDVCYPAKCAWHKFLKKLHRENYR